METESETLNNLFKCFDWNPDLLKLPNLCFYSIICLHSFFMVWQVLAADVGQGVILPSLQGERKTRCGSKGRLEEPSKAPVPPSCPGKGVSLRWRPQWSKGRGGTVSSGQEGARPGLQKRLAGRLSSREMSLSRGGCDALCNSFMSSKFILYSSPT